MIGYRFLWDFDDIERNINLMIDDYSDKMVMVKRIISNTAQNIEIISANI